MCLILTTLIPGISCVYWNVLNQRCQMASKGRKGMNGSQNCPEETWHDGGGREGMDGSLTLTSCRYLYRQIPNWNM